MKQAGRKSGRLSYGNKDPKLKESTIDWDKLRRKNEERLDREWDEGIRRNDTIRRRWMKTLTPERREKEYRLLAEGKRTPLVLGPDGEPHSTDSGASGVKGPSTTKGMRNFDLDEIVRLYVNENMSPGEISAYYNGRPSYQTVINYLKKANVFDPQKHRTGGRNEAGPQRQRQDKCAKGHDLTNPENVLERFRRLPDGTTRPNGRECRICNRERQRKLNKYKWENDPRNPKNGGNGTHANR